MNSTFTTVSAKPPVAHTFTRQLDTAAASLDALQRCTSISSLREALSALCSRYGQLHGLNIVSSGQPGRRRALCFLRMQTSDQEKSLMHALGIGRFGGGLVLVLTLTPDSPTGDLHSH
jgi:hypothetical protein